MYSIFFVMRSVTFVTGLADTKTPYIIHLSESAELSLVQSSVTCPLIGWHGSHVGPNQHNFHPAGDRGPASEQGEAVTRNMTQRGHEQWPQPVTPGVRITMHNITFLSRSHTILRTAQSQPRLTTQDCSEILTLLDLTLQANTLCSTQCQKTLNYSFKKSTYVYC